jgi:hypothetical protein
MSHNLRCRLWKKDDQAARCMEWENISNNSGRQTRERRGESSASSLNRDIAKTDGITSHVQALSTRVTSSLSSAQAHFSIILLSTGRRTVYADCKAFSTLILRTMCYDFGSWSLGCLPHLSSPHLQGHNAYTTSTVRGLPHLLAHQ